jgi:uncharacterized protein YndB with AHSA1/START domain
MTVRPIKKEIEVKAPPARAFAVFTERMFDWWPKEHTIAPGPRENVIIEGHVGGRWFERAVDGSETDWGKVLAWEPPRRLLLSWQINAQWKCDPDFVTEVELLFRPHGTGTIVSLEHRDLERFGTDAAGLIEQLRNGWPKILELYGSLADQDES